MGTHNIVAGFSVETKCTHDMINRRPSEFDILARNESAIIKFLPQWDDEGYASCDEEWTNTKETVCASVWALDADSETVPKFQITVKEIMILDVFRSEKPRGVKDLKSGSDVAPCDVIELTQSAYNQQFSKYSDKTPTCAINHAGEVARMHGYELTDADCAVVGCGP